MPKYALEIGGKTYDIESEKALSDTDLASYASKIAAPVAQPRGTVPAEQAPLIDRAKAFVGPDMSKMIRGAGVQTTPYGAEALQGPVTLSGAVLQGLGSGAARSVAGITELGARAAGAEGLQKGAKAIRESIPTMLAEYKEAYPMTTGGAELVGEAVAPTAALMKAGQALKAIGAAAPMLGRVLTPAGEAIATGGFRTGLQPGVANRLAQLAGGATAAGATQAMLSGDISGETGTAAGIGAALPIALPALGKLGVKGLGSVADFVTGRTAQVKAGELARAAAGGDLAAIKAANAAAPNMPAELAAAGINRDTYFALLDEAAKKDPNGFVRAMRAAEAPEHINELAKLAGGPTQTASREAVQASKNTLNAITGPMMATELNAAGTAGKFIKTKGPQIYQKYDSMVDALQQTGQMYAEANAVRLAANQKRAELVKKLNSPTPGWVSQKTIDKLDQEIAVLDQNAAKAKQAVEEMNAIKFQRQDEGEFAVRQVQSLAAYGLKPIDTDSIVGNIAQKIENPKIGVSDESRKVLLAVADKIQEWTAKGGGYIDPAALHEIRKTYVNEVIQKELAGRDPSYIARQAAKVTGELRPLIDDAIEKAGGTDWRKALDTHAKGMQQLEQRTMSAQLMDMYDKAQANPTEFLRLVRGNNPDAVEKVFGPGSFSLAQQMGEKMRPLEKIASEVERRQAITEMAKQGRAALATVAEGQQGTSLRLPFFNRTASVMNKVADILEGKVERKTMNALIEGARSGKNMNELLNTLPASERNKVLLEIQKSAQKRPLGYSAGAGQLQVER